MSVRDERREAAIERMADHLLQAGMAGASLRPLAVAAGTSDRMLLYYFSNREELLAATLERVAMRMGGLLQVVLLAEAPMAFGELLGAVWTAMKAPALQPFMHLWLELAAGAARGQEPHRMVAGRIADGFLQWLMSRLKAPDAERTRLAGLLLATLEGLLVLDGVGRRPVADAAVTLAATWSDGQD